MVPSLYMPLLCVTFTSVRSHLFVAYFFLILRLGKDNALPLSKAVFLDDPLAEQYVLTDS